MDRLAAFSIIPFLLACRVAAAGDAPPPAPSRAVLLAVDYAVLDMALTGTRSRLDWENVAGAALRAALAEALAGHPGIALVELPAVAPAEADLLEEHGALASLVLRVRDDQDDSAWRLRAQSLDHGVGTGLDFLREPGGAELGIVLTGWQVEQSAGTVAASLALSAAGVITVPFANKRLIAGVFDLATGRLLWSEAAGGAEVLGLGGPDLRKEDSARRVLGRLFQSYAGAAPAGAP